jgi:hypothetical protein
MNESANVSGIEQRVRERAYAIWEREGRPFGREIDHWRISEQTTLAELTVTAPARKASKAKAAPRKTTVRRATPVLEMSASA